MNVRALSPIRVERVDTIANMMARGEWQAGKSHRELAEEWGVTQNTVERYAAEASRMVLRHIDREAITGQSLAAYERVLRLAFEKRTPDLRHAIMALDSRAKLLKLGGFAEAKAQESQRLPTTAQQRLAWVRANLPELERQAALEAANHGQGQQGNEAPVVVGATSEEGTDGDSGDAWGEGVSEGESLRGFDPGYDGG